jgi:hypothetical protein
MLRPSRLLGELDAPFDFAQDRIVGQDRLDAAGHGFQQVFEELPSRPPVSLVDQLGDRELAGAVDADEQVQPFDKLRSALSPSTSAGGTYHALQAPMQL